MYVVLSTYFNIVLQISVMHISLETSWDVKIIEHLVSGNLITKLL